MSENPGLAIQTVESSILRADPEHALPILIECVDKIAAQAVGITWTAIVVFKPPGCDVNPGEPPPSADPKHALTIFVESIDLIVTYASWVVPVVQGPNDVACRLIPPTEPAVLSPDP